MWRDVSVPQIPLAGLCFFHLEKFIRWVANTVRRSNQQVLKKNIGDNVLVSKKMYFCSRKILE